MWTESDNGLVGDYLSTGVVAVHLFSQSPENVSLHGGWCLVFLSQSGCQWVSETSHCFAKIAEQSSALRTKIMPCWFHLISDHRLCSPVIIRKYLFQTLGARNVILWFKETIPAMWKRQRWRKIHHFWKMYLCVHSPCRLVLFFLHATN